MNEETFWHVISLFDWSHTGNDDAMLEPAIDDLSARSPEEICRFADLLAEKLHSLDTRKHARACYAGELNPNNGDDYISADDFLYQRCVVVANGSNLYAEALADPAEMPQGLEFEALLYLPSKAYERATGLEYDYVTALSYESFQNSEGWKPTQATRPGKYTGDNIPPGNRRPT